MRGKGELEFIGVVEGAGEEEATSVYFSSQP